MMLVVVMLGFTAAFVVAVVAVGVVVTPEACLVVDSAGPSVDVVIMT